MSLLNNLFDWLGLSSGADSIGGASGVHDDAGCIINPATGLPMVNGCSGVDINGNFYGVEMHDNDSWSSPLGGMNDEAWSSDFSSWNDSLSNDASGWDRGIGSSWDD